MNEEQHKPKVSLVTVDLSTTVKPIAISDEEAIEKAKRDNETQAKFDDDSIEVVETNVTKALEYEAEIQLEDPEQKELVEEAMKEANARMDAEAFHKTNDFLKATDHKKMNKQLAIIFAIIMAILLILLIIELPSFIETFE